MVELTVAEFTLAIIIGTLFAIVYSLRYLVILERRIASMEENIQRIANKILKEEKIIERRITKRKRKR